MSDTEEKLTTAQKLQSFLDSNKHQLTDSLYMGMCLINADAYKEEKNNLYTVKYISTSIYRQCTNIYKTAILKHSQILTLTTEQYECIKRHTEGGNLCSTCCILVLDDVLPRLVIQPNPQYAPIERSLCYCEVEDDDKIPDEISIIPSIKIISVEKYK